MAFPPRSWSQALLKLGCWARDAGCIHRESFLTFLSFIHELSCAWHLRFDVQNFEIYYMIFYDVIWYYSILYYLFLSILCFKIIHIIMLQTCCGNWMSHWPMHQSRMSQVELEGQSLKREPHLCTVCLCFPTLSRLVDELVIHADTESDVSPVFRRLFCLNLGWGLQHRKTCKASMGEFQVWGWNSCCLRQSM